MNATEKTVPNAVGCAERAGFVSDRGPDEQPYVNEAGLYMLALHPEAWDNAAEFQRWVCEEVLVSIRKHGVYPPPGEMGKRPGELLPLLGVIDLVTGRRTDA